MANKTGIALQIEQLKQVLRAAGLKFSLSTQSVEEQKKQNQLKSLQSGFTYSLINQLKRIERLSEKQGIPFFGIRIKAREIQKKHKEKSPVFLLQKANSNSDFKRFYQITYDPKRDEYLIKKRYR